MSSGMPRRIMLWKCTDVSKECTSSTFRIRNKPSRQQALLSDYLLVIDCLAYSSTLKMEAARSSETAVNLYRTP
jgi:hypothetical protein